MGIKESIKRKRDEKNEVGGIRTHDKMVFWMEYNKLPLMILECDHYPINGHLLHSIYAL
jgi:hypothetical protein